MDKHSLYPRWRLYSDVSKCQSIYRFAIRGIPIMNNETDFMPVYYQACKGLSPITSGVDYLGTPAAACIAGVISGISVSVTKHYRPQFYLSWVLLTIGSGLMSSITVDTSQGATIGYQIILGLGIGVLFSLTYVPILAPLPTSATAKALSFYIYVRWFALVRFFSVREIAVRQVTNDT